MRSPTLRASTRIVDLRPGTYCVTFTLSGFTTLRRDEIELPANFTASLNADLRIGGIEESVTVSGASPVVDVQSTERRSNLSREVLDALPTARSYQTIGQTLPALTSGAGRFDVGGSTSMWQSQLAAFGGRAQDMAINIDGLSMNTPFASGQTVSFYHNDGAYQEMVYQISSGSAETQTPGVSINMIPREGGNRYSSSFVGIYSADSLQSTNFSEELRARGLTAPARLDRTWDVNAGVGGPIVRDRLWFYGSLRNWAYNNRVAGIFLPNGEQAVDDNLVEAYTGRLTLQATPRNKLTAAYENNPRWRGHRDIETGLVSPEATGLNENDNAFFTQAKWTSTVTNKLLFELGMSYLHFNYWIGYRPEVRLATCTVAFTSCPAGTDYGDISHVEITNDYGRWPHCATSTTTSRRRTSPRRSRTSLAPMRSRWGSSGDGASSKAGVRRTATSSSATATVWRTRSRSRTRRPSPSRISMPTWAYTSRTPGRSNG